MNELLVTYTPTTSREKAAYKLDHMIFAGILLLAALPFGQILSLRLGPAIVNVSEIILLLLAALLLFRVVFVARSTRVLPIAVLVLVVGWTLIDTILWRSPRTDYMVYQLRGFLAFPIAALLLFSGTTVPIRRVMLGLSIAGMVSALSVLAVNHFAPGLVTNLFFGSNYYTGLMAQGRVYWPNQPIALLSLVSLVLFAARGSRYRTAAYLAGLVALVALFATLNRTLAIAVVLLCLAMLWMAQRSRDLNRVVLVLLGLVALAGAAIAIWVLLSPSVAEGARARFVGSNAGFDFTHLYQQAVIQGRVPLIRQYFEVPWQTLLWGRGFGTPFATGSAAFITADIAFLSFLLPYGVVGVLAFLLFLVSLHRAIPRSGQTGISLDRLLRAVFWVALLVSFNVDVFARDYFAVYLTLAIVSLRSTYLVAEAQGTVRSTDPQAAGLLPAAQIS